MKVLVTQLCPTFCNPMNCSPLGSSVEFSRQEYWSWLPFPSPGYLPFPGIQPGFLHCRQTLYQLRYQGRHSKAPCKIVSWCVVQLCVSVHVCACVLFFNVFVNVHPGSWAFQVVLTWEAQW